jgi:hypothetical protein
MKINLKKVATVLGSALMLGSTAAFAAAASFTPSSFTDGGVALVVGQNAAASDLKAATDLTAALAPLVGPTTTAVKAGDVKVTDDEITMGGLITGGDIDTALKDNKLSTLADDKFTWDDGADSDEYNYHEEISIGTANVLTTLDDKKLDGVALSNENALEYKFVFDEDLNESAVGTDDADTLYLTIMGQKYEIEAMDSSSITVTTSEKMSLTVGEEITVAGKTIKLVDVFENDVEVEVDGVSETIADADTERISGMRIHVESIGYHSNDPASSKAILKIGEDISKKFDNNEEFIGQDEDDPLWVWDISNPGDAAGYIGVKYNAKINSANDEIAGDSIKYVGSGYLFPNNYVAVTLDSVTAAKYQDLKVYFEESEDLFNNSDSSTALVEDQPVLVIEAEETDAITVNSIETDKVFVWYNASSGKVQTFYRDFDGDYTPTGKMRLANNAAGTVSAVTMGATEIATVEVGDTNLDIDMEVAAGVAYLEITNDDFGNNQVAKIRLNNATLFNATARTGTLNQFGETEEDAEAGDVLFNGTDVSTEDYDFMDHYGIKLSDGTTVSKEADNDMVTLSIPEEQVYAQVTVSMGATTDTPSTSGIVTVYDNQVSTVAGKNLIVIGGSCVNTVAAELLGLTAGASGCQAAFTTSTGIKSGEALIQSFARSGKIALLVAGYDAADTTKAVTYLSNNNVNTAVGSKMKVTSATTATAITA